MRSDSYEGTETAVAARGEKPRNTMEKSNPSFYSTAKTDVQGILIQRRLQDKIMFRKFFRVNIS